MIKQIFSILGCYRFHDKILWREMLLFEFKIIINILWKGGVCYVLEYVKGLVDYSGSNTAE